MGWIGLMPYDPTDAARRLRSLLDRDPALAFTKAFLRDHPGADLYLVGGALRDALLGRDAKDVDLVARGRARGELERWLRSRGAVELVGETFGVYKFLPHGISPKERPFVDVALPRREHASAGSLGGYRDFDLQVDPMLPIEADLARRDFTVNAMAYDLRRGTIVDPWHGQSDLRLGVIRAVGVPGERFLEDLSRLLRAIRFAAELGFDIEDATRLALHEAAPNINDVRETDGVRHFVVPRETVGSELAKAFVAHAFVAADLLQKSGLMRELLPEAEASFSGDARFFEPLRALPAGRLTAALALLMRAVPAATVIPALKRVGLDTLPSGSPLRAHLDDVAWIVTRIQQGAPDPATMRPGLFERTFMNGHAKNYVLVLKALGNDAVVAAAEMRAQELRRAWGVTEDERIPALVSGDDAIAAGLAPGPRVRLALDAVRDAQLEGTVMTRTRALKWLKEHLGTAY
ncbi:CCA tRNA nucleotidyltransferase [Patescibacteria group bacterium]|nr:MAG: CCA tRNA nucleotidyltransferase [Patescibacteria group bacterium]